MISGSDLRISRCANGFLVTSTTSSMMDKSAQYAESMVFDSIERLQDWMARHFARPEQQAKSARPIESVLGALQGGGFKDVAPVIPRYEPGPFFDRGPV